MKHKTCFAWWFVGKYRSRIFEKIREEIEPVDVWWNPGVQVSYDGGTLVPILNTDVPYDQLVIQQLGTVVYITLN